MSKIKIKYLENRIQELENKLGLNRKSLWKELLCFIGSCLLVIVNFYLIINAWKLLNLGDLTEGYLVSFNQLLILYPLIFEYVSISLFVICLVAWVKNGFENLKSYKEKGVIAGLIAGLIFGLIEGLIFGLIAGLILGLIGGLILWLIGGLEGEFD